MQRGDKVRFNGGMFVGYTGTVLKTGGMDGMSTVSVRLKEGREVTEYTKYVEPVTRDNADFLYTLDLGSRTVHVHLNDLGRENEAYVSLSTGGFVVKGKKNLEEFIRAVAIAGDLIKEDEDLVVKPKAKFELPEDGTYSLKQAGVTVRPVFVVKGVLWGINVFDPNEIVDLTTFVTERIESGEGYTLDRVGD